MISKKRVQFNVITTEDNNEKNVIISLKSLSNEEI